jgi:hypothetical protein
MEQLKLTLAFLLVFHYFDSQIKRKSKGSVTKQKFEGGGPGGQRWANRLIKGMFHKCEIVIKATLQLGKGGAQRRVCVLNI